MKTIIYECGLPNTLSGGFGDRVIGIISCLALSEYLGAQLQISWNDTPLCKFFDYLYKPNDIQGIIKSFVSHNIDDLKNTFSNKTPIQINEITNII